MKTKIGTKVKTIGQNGGIKVGAAGDAGKFDVNVPPGTEGVVVAEHPSPKLKGWWLVRVQVDGIDYDVPLNGYQVDVCEVVRREILIDGCEPEPVRQVSGSIAERNSCPDGKHCCAHGSGPRFQCCNCGATFEALKQAA